LAKNFKRGGEARHNIIGFVLRDSFVRPRIFVNIFLARNFKRGGEIND